MGKYIGAMNAKFYQQHWSPRAVSQCALGIGRWRTRLEQELYLSSNYQRTTDLTELYDRLSVTAIGFLQQPSEHVQLTKQNLAQLATGFRLLDIPDTELF